MVGHVPVPVRGTLPHTHGGQMFRLPRGHLPLVDAVIGHTIEAHLATAPRLRARPLDALFEVICFPRREMLNITR